MSYISEQSVEGKQGEQTTDGNLHAESLRLEEILTLEQLQNMRHYFSQINDESEGGRKKVNQKEFHEIVGKFVSEGMSYDLSKMFSKMDVHGEGLVDWEEFCSYLLMQYHEKDSLKQVAEPFQDLLPKVRSMYSKETICRVLCIPGPSRIVSVCKDASIGVWSPSLQYQHGFQATEEETLVTVLFSGGSKRSKLLVTDCVVMENCAKLVLAVTKRELQFHDVPTAVHSGQTLKIKLFDLPYVALCLDYHCSEREGVSSCLVYGDEIGDVHVLKFANPAIQLFSVESRKSSDVTPKVCYSMLRDHAPHVIHQHVAGVHEGWIKRVLYVPDKNSVISCSSIQPSLVIKDLSKIQKPYVFKIRKGVECFTYDSQLVLLATGGMDHVVRLWNPYVTTKPTAYLTKHSGTILDMIMEKSLGILFTYSQDGLLCSWDLREHILVQAITVKFPFIQRQPDHGMRSIVRGFRSKFPSIIVSENEFMMEYELGLKAGQQSSSGVVTTHQHPITAAIYSPLFRQVIVSCEGSVITVWDIDTGGKVLHFPRCHGNDEITCMSLDSSGRRLMTGSRYGDVRVWNYHTGECLKTLHHPQRTEVTGVIGISEKNLFITVGWNKRVTLFADKEDLFDVKPMEGWEETGQHEDDILSCSFLEPRYLVTGSFDGVIKIWNTENTQLVRQFSSPSPAIVLFDPKRTLRKKSCASFKSKSNSLCSSFVNSLVSTSRPESRRMSHYRHRLSLYQDKRAPVDQVLFLQERAKSRVHHCGILVSSDHGEARFWDLFGPTEPLGSFPLTDNDEEHVLALTTDPGNKLLIAGDTAGCISVFDIARYCCGHEDADSCPPRPLYSWSAHSAEIVSVQYISPCSGETDPLVLSSSSDATARLWTLKGHYIGVFGQETLWRLSSPASYQHPKTPWGKPSRSQISSHSMKSLSSKGMASVRSSGVMGVASRLPTPSQELHEEAEAEDTSHISDTESISPENFELPRSLLRENERDHLGEPYKEQLIKRMKDRKGRREVYADIDSKTVQRFGTICSPFQALQLTSVNDSPSHEGRSQETGQNSSKNTAKAKVVLLQNKV